MKIKRIIMEYENYGLPTRENRTTQNIRLHLFYKTFEHGNSVFSYENIKQINFNLFAIESFFRLHDFCFRPKWYQCLKFYSYFYINKIVDLLKVIFK